MTPESKLKKAAAWMLKEYGVFNFPLTAGLGSYAGLPDRVAHYKGKVHYLEFKAENGRLGPRQKQFQAQCKKDSVRYHVIRDLTDLEQALDLPTLFKGNQ